MSVPFSLLWIESTLKLLFDKYGSDKGNLNNKHSYYKVYESLFNNIRNDSLNIMEVGLGSIDEKVDFHMKFMGKNYRPLASLLHGEIISKMQIFMEPI